MFFLPLVSCSILTDIYVAEVGTQVGTPILSNAINTPLHAKASKQVGIFVTMEPLINATRVITNVYVDQSDSCVQGYVKAKGGLDGNINHFTRCKRTTVCVKYAIKGDSDLLVSRVFLSKDGWNPNKLTAFVQNIDLVQGCGQKVQLGVEFQSLTQTESFVQDKRAILEQYAPYYMLHSEEAYFPSSVSWFFDRSVRRFVPNEGWVLFTTAPYKAGWGNNANWRHPELRGVSELDQVPTYGYYLDKGNGVVDLSYYVFFPFNFGKEIPIALFRVYGNHVGDWEHVTIRLINGVPAQAYISSHNFGETANWDLVEKRNGRGVFYCAKGSHGFWRQPGTHNYLQVAGGVVTLKDETNNGREWDTKRNLESFGWTRQTNTYEILQGNRESTSWPVWMTKSDKNPSNGNENPRSGPIDDWGDAKEEGCIFGQCILEKGPSGPIDKGIWGDELR